MFRIVLLSISTLLLQAVALSQTVQGLRAMPTEELILRADAIVRGEIKKINKVVYLGSYTQRVTVRVSEVLKGDRRWVGQDLTVWAGSRLMHAEDQYEEKTDRLLFLAREQTFFYTLNYQHGQFLIEGDAIKNWRVTKVPPTAPPDSVENLPQSNLEDDFDLVSRPYQDVRKEILGVLRLYYSRTPKK